MKFPNVVFWYGFIAIILAALHGLKACKKSCCGKFWHMVLRLLSHASFVLIIVTKYNPYKNFWCLVLEKSHNIQIRSIYSRVPNKTGENLILLRMFFPPTCPYSWLLVYQISSCFINFQEKIPSYTFIWDSCYIRK